MRLPRGWFDLCPGHGRRQSHFPVCAVGQHHSLFAGMAMVPPPSCPSPGQLVAPITARVGATEGEKPNISSQSSGVGRGLTLSLAV